MSTLTKERLALKIADNKKSLLKELKETKSFLMPFWAKYFKTYKFDFEKKRLVGSGNIILQWQLRSYPDNPESYHNQQTNRGIVCICGIQGDDSLIYFSR